MKKTAVYLILFIVLISGCEKPDRLNSETGNTLKKRIDSLKSPNDTNKIKTGIFKGIFSNLNKTKTLTGCGNGKKIIVADGSETAEVERIFDEHSGKGIYIEAEGFTSSKSGINGKGIDSVLIITRVIKYEKQSECK